VIFGAFLFRRNSISIEIARMFLDFSLMKALSLFEVGQISGLARWGIRLPILHIVINKAIDSTH